MFPLLFPMILPTNYDIPPTLYDIMEAMVNFDREDKIKIRDLPKYARSKIFDFNYPLSDKVNQEEFEELILKKFMMRRIGYETVTAFKLALEVKLNEIMPTYNKLFDSLENWNILEDGETESRIVEDSRNTSSTSTSNGVNVSDRRFSELPQNRINDLQSGDYITDYNLDTDNSNMTGTNNMSDNGNLSENIKKTPSDKIKIYKEFMNDVNSIYTMIFDKLDDLFYGLVM